MFKFIYLFIFLLFTGFGHSNENKHKILVTIPPYKSFVNQIAGDLVDVEVLVPPGASSHTYEPTPKQVIRISDADVWFMIGEGMERKVLSALKGYHPQLKIVDLRKGIDLISSNESCCPGEATDPHIWLSPKLAIKQAETIAKILSEQYPEHQAFFKQRLEVFVQDLNQLHIQIKKMLSNNPKKSFLVSHPAYGYFAREYGLTQLSIEFEGKDPTPQRLTKLLQRAREEKIKKIFIQKQYPNKGARLIAKEIGAELINTDPYSTEYEKSLLELAKQISTQ